ncbi:MAG: response regulator [Actinomycetota bacterium]
MTQDSFRVLLVDDEPADIELTRMALSHAPIPCQVMTAANGREALGLLQRERSEGKRIPDLILLDLNMPQMNGYDVLKAMKEDGGLSSIPVVVLTTSCATEDVKDVYRMGASGFITKPSDVDDLFRFMHAVLEYWGNTVRRP